MIRLGVPPEPRWLELGHGVRVYVRPLTTAVYEAAKVTGRRMGMEAGREQGLIEEAGGRVEDVPDVRDPDALAGLSAMFFTVALASHGILDWEGIGQPDGDGPAPASRENIALLFRGHPALAEEFAVQYTAPHRAMVAEGNDSRPAQDGTTAAGRDTAETAEG